MNKVSNLILNLRLIPRTLAAVRHPARIFWDYLGLVRTDYVVELRTGIKLRIRAGTTDKGIVKEVFLLDHYGFARPWLRPGAVVVDVGAQIGAFSLYAARQSPDLVVHSFEPMSENFALLAHNAALNGFGQVHPHRQAVTALSGPCRLFLSEDNTGMHSLHRPGPRHETVEGVGINDLFARLDIPHCDVLKLDCEGAELEILRAANPDVLARIGCLVMEWHEADTVPELTQRLIDAGFTVQLVEGQALLYAHRGPPPAAG